MKKLIVIAALFVTTLSFGQDCSLVRTFTDDVTGASGPISKEIILTDDEVTGIIFYGFKLPFINKIFLYFNAYGASDCIKDDNTMFILFTDGSRMVFSNDQDFNCENKFSIEFLLTNADDRADLYQLRTKTIKKVRVYSSDGSVEQELPATEAAKIKNIINCLWTQK